MNPSYPFQGALLSAVFRRTLQGLFAVGVGVWAVVLLAPVPDTPPPALQAQSSARADTAALESWFGGSGLNVPVVVVGVLARADGSGAAVLSVSGAAQMAYRSGDTLAPGVVLHHIAHDHVIVLQDGNPQRVPVQASSLPVVNGFIPVSANGAR